MEKILKSQVHFNDTVFNDSTEQAIDVDFTLPDYCPDISKIFKCNAVPRISSKSINGKTITIDGQISITLLYCDKDGEFCSFDYQYPFSKSLEMKNECVNANLCAKIKTDYINCRAVTGRKVDIHGAASIFVKVFKKMTTEIISDYDDKNVELRRGTAPATIPMGYAEKYLLIEEDIRIGDTKPAIRNILRSDASSSIKETKVINGKAVVKGEMSVSILYCPEKAGGPQCVKTVIPFSQIIDVDGINETCECETKSEIAFCEVKPRMTQTGENRSISFTAKVLLTCEGYCPNDIAVIFDAFSRKFEAEIKSDKICFEKITHNIREPFSCKKNIKLDENISSVIDLSAVMGTVNTKFHKDELIISGSVISGMMICNEEGNTIYCEKPIDFEYKYPLNTTLTLPHCEPQIEIKSCGYTISAADNIEVRIDLLINASVYEKKDISLIREIIVDETKPTQKFRKSAMTIYFPNNKECVWDIARIYNASVDEIMRINELESEELTAGKMILVPVM